VKYINQKPMSSGNCEQELLLQIATGDQFAFRKLFMMYHQQLGNFIFRITESKELAEEIVQDVFMKIWTQRQSLNEVQSFKAYLFVLSRNHSLNSLRKLARERLRKVQWEDNFANIPESAEMMDYYTLLDKAIDLLPPQQQKVYLLSRHKRLKYMEISNELNISAETVKKYLKIANSSITTYMRDHIETVSLLIILYTFLK
jgi:RNA polymerase sigma-70 factor (family 1)